MTRPNFLSWWVLYATLCSVSPLKAQFYLSASVSQCVKSPAQNQGSAVMFFDFLPLTFDPLPLMFFLEILEGDRGNLIILFVFSKRVGQGFANYDSWDISCPMLVFVNEVLLGGKKKPQLLLTYCWWLLSFCKSELNNCDSDNPCHAQLCPTLCDPRPGSSVHRIFLARIMTGKSYGQNIEVGAISSSRGSSQRKDRTQICCIASRCFMAESLGKPIRDHQNLNTYI